MSWDFWLESTDGDELAGYDANYTYNVSPMYYKAFAGDEGIRGLDGCKCELAETILINAIEYMEQNKDEMIFLNPSNGWGDYWGALALLKKLQNWCISKPHAIIRVE